MMMTLNELATAHGLNPKSLWIYLKAAGIKATGYQPEWPRAALYNEEAAAAVAEFLNTSSKSRKRGRPRKNNRATEASQ